MSKEIIIDSTDVFNFCFENKEGEKFYTSLDYKQIKELCEDTAFENLPEDYDCQSSTCKVEGFCECGSIYDDMDLELKTITVNKQ